MNDKEITDDKISGKKLDKTSSVKLEIELPDLKLHEKLLIDSSNKPCDLKDDLNDKNINVEKIKENESEERTQNSDPENQDITDAGNNQLVSGFNSFVNNIMPSPFEDNESEDEDDEVIEEEPKVKFNHKVSELAEFYIKENQMSSFYFFQFLQTVIIHLIYYVLGPLSVPILFWVFGRNFTINMGFYGKKVGASHIIQIFYWLTFLATTVFTIMIQIADKTSIFYKQYVFLCPAYISQIMILIRYITVCVKYGFFPPDYYKKLTKTRLTRTELKSNFLLQGWIKPSLLVLDVYLKEIFQKFNIDVNKFKFQCIGSLSKNLKEDLNHVDLIINEDVKKIRQSVFRRFNKKDKFYNMIQDVIKKYKIEKKLKTSKTKKSNAKETDSKLIPSIELSTKIQDQQKGELNESINDLIDQNDFKKNNLKTQSKPSPAILRFREFYDKKLLPLVRKNLNKKLDPLDNIVKYKNEFVYEIKGFYLCRAILKNVFTVDLLTYSSLHKFMMLILVLTPFVFTFSYYFFFNEFIEMIKNEEIPNKCAITNDTTKTDTSNLKFTINYMSIIFLVFSFFSILAPTWLNTLNLIYGVIDIRRRKRLMEIISEVFDTNIIFEKRIYPLFNILHGPTILNWYSLRTIFMSYGKRFGDRILFQTSIYCLFVIVSIIFSFFSLFGKFDPFISMVKFLFNFV